MARPGRPDQPGGDEDQSPRAMAKSLLSSVQAPRPGQGPYRSGPTQALEILPIDRRLALPSEKVAARESRSACRQPASSSSIPDWT